MPLIGIDASRANGDSWTPGQRTGTEWYAYHLIQHLKNIKMPGLEFVLYSRSSLRDGLEELPDGWHTKVLGWPLRRLWNQIRLSQELWQHPVDLFFQPVHTLPLYKPKRIVMTLHDIGFEKLSKLYTPSELRYHRFAARLAVRRSDCIITVSEFSRREILERYKLPPERIVAIPLAVDTARYRPDLSETEEDAVLMTYRLSRPFFIYIGRIEEKKNIVNLLHAFSVFKNLRGVGDPIKLLLIGHSGFGFDRIKKEISARKLGSNVVMPGYVPEADMPALIGAAKLLLLPSWYEGFGLPILQAQACGTPVITSNVASMPEVGGRAAFYVDPGEPEDIARAMRILVDDEAEWGRRRALGLENVKRFSWDATARRTRDVLYDALGMPRP